MHKFIIITLIIIVVELIITWVFAVITKKLYEATAFSTKSILKGLAERLFLLIALANNYSQALTFFSALKIATRLKHQETNTEESDKYNDYYLLGNLISVAVAIGYTYLYLNFDKFGL